MADIFAKSYLNPSDGDIVELPDDRESAVERLGNPQIGSQSVSLTVVGTGNVERAVLRTADAHGQTTVPDKSIILGVDGGQDDVYYAIRAGEY